MGWFKKYQSAVIVQPGAVNIDKAPAKTGTVTLDEAKRALRLDDNQTLFEDGIWKMRSNDCRALSGNGYWIGTLKPKGSFVAVYVGSKQVGSLEPRSTDSGKKAIKEYGGKQARCVISNTSPTSWNVYVDMR